MSSASSLSARIPAEPVWSLAVSGAVRGLSLARESGWALVRDERHWLYLLDRVGKRHGQLRAPRELTASACADDGSAFAAGGKDGEVWWLAPDLMPRWQRALGQRVEAVAVDPLGQYLAASDATGRLFLFTRKGRPVWRLQVPRPLRHLAFVPEAPFLLGSADYGLVGCFDAQGNMVWRDGLVAHVGSLAASGDGSALLACFSDGLNRYALKGPPAVRQPLPSPCRVAALSYDGGRVLAAGLSASVALIDAGGRARGEYKLESPAAAVALSPLADRAVVGTVSGQVIGLKWR